MSIEPTIGSNLVQERRKVDAAQKRMMRLDEEEKSLRDEKDKLVEGHSTSRVENEKLKVSSMRDSHKFFPRCILFELDDGLECVST